MSIKFTQKLGEIIRKKISENLVIIEGKNGPEIMGTDNFISLEDYMSSISPLDNVFKFSIKLAKENVKITKKMNKRLGFINPNDYE